MELRLAPNLRAAAQTDAGARWLGRLPRVVGELAQRWSLTLGDPYEPGGHCAWVAPALTAAGERLVIKVGWRHYESEHEADGLRAWRGRGAVLVHAAEAWDDCSALLLERCEPGRALAIDAAQPEQDLVIAGLLRRLWSIPVDGSRFRPLQSMCDAWADEFTQRRGERPSTLDPGLERTGIELLRSLPASAQRSVLLATDLHAGNVVASQREPWLAIDPKPYLGDPAYDVLQHMLNCDRLIADPRGLARRMAELLELDAERVMLWLFARCVQESIDQPELARVAERLAPS